MSVAGREERACVRGGNYGYDDDRAGAASEREYVR